MPKFYLTTAIDYTNGPPHFGHAYEKILADAICRQRRLAGDAVHFLTGTDEHGQKVAKSAADKGLEPQALVDGLSAQFRALWEKLGIRYDQFIRTTDPQHKKAVQEALARLQKDGQIYPADYEGWYCLPDERFWTEKDLVDGNCPECKRPVQKIKEKNYFFRMSRYQVWLIDHIKTHPEFVQPETRRNEVLGFLQKPLEDLCISRPRARISWGVPLPFDEDQVTYVWFDALLNYVTAIGWPFDMKRFESLWPADIHLVGKDILTPHTVYWPTMLKALGIPMPKTVLVHGWILLAGAKMGKSAGNAVSPLDLLEKHGADPIRHFFLRDVTLGMDGEFSQEQFRTRYNIDLANNLGNLLSRTVAMLEKYRGGQVPAPAGEPSAFAREIREKLLGPLPELLRKDRPQETEIRIWEAIDRANREIEERKPWALAKDPAKAGELDRTLYELWETLRILSGALEPYLPSTVIPLRRQLGLSDATPYLTWGSGTGGKVQKGTALFPRMEEEEKP